MFRSLWILAAYILYAFWVIAQSAIASGGLGSVAHPIVDSDMSEKEAFDGLDPECPRAVRERQRLASVLYYSFDMKVHKGQLVIDKDLVGDIQHVFKVCLQEKFPIRSVIPISHPRFRKEGRWDDNLSMAANNTSAFNYRLIARTKKISNHAFGRAIDINPVQNPYIKGDIILPEGSKYDPKAPGTLTATHPVVRTFISLGWAWGGDWDTRKDYQHFEKSMN